MAHNMAHRTTVLASGQTGDAHMGVKAIFASSVVIAGILATIFQN